jgi:pilus assembly protein CpaE
MNQRDQNDARATVVCVLGASGGVGASTVAANLALSLQQAHSAQSVAVMDTTLTGGDLPLMLGVAPGTGLRSLPTDPRLVDEALLMNAQTTHRSGVTLLRLGQSSPLRPLAEPAVLARTLDLMAQWYAWIVVDCGCATERVAHTVIPHASTVLLVATLALPSAQRAKQWAEWLIGIGVPSGKLVAVMNRCREDEAAYRREVPSIFPCRVGAYLPDAPEPAREALIEGVPLAAIQPCSALAQGYAELAGALSGQTAGVSDRNTRGLLQRLHARFMGRRHAA